MAYRPDLAVYERSGDMLLAVEVQTARSTSTQWAVEVRSYLLELGASRRVPYFLLASPNRFYLWKNGEGVTAASNPTYEGDPSALLFPYLRGAGIRPETISQPGFELVVSAILWDIAGGWQPSSPPSSELAWLFDSGLYDALQGARVTAEALV